MDQKQIKKWQRYLVRAAKAKWPFLSDDDAYDRAMDTICLALESAEVHPVKYWARGMLWNGNGRRGYEVGFEDLVGDDFEALERWPQTTFPDQDHVVLARDAMRLVCLLPDRERQIMMSRATGNNPVDVAKKFGMSIKDVMECIAAARKIMSVGAPRRTEVLPRRKHLAFNELHLMQD